MSDPDPPPADNLDQLFAAPDVGPNIAPVEELTPAAVFRAEPPEEVHRPQSVVRLQDVLFKLTPYVWVTPLLLVANVGVYLWMVIGGVNPWMPATPDLIKWGANYAPRTWNQEPWRLLTSTFLHAGVLHLAVNMWALWSIGRMLERLIGNVGFLILYFACGIAGSLTSVWWNGDVVSAGASGAIFGLIGGFATFVWNRSDSFPMRALTDMRNSLVSCIGFNLLLGASIEGIDQAAHIGGLVWGLICGWFLSQPLDQQTGQRRFAKNLLVTAVSVLGLGLGVLQHPPPPPDIVTELDNYAEQVPKILDRFNSLAKEFDAGTKTLQQARQLADVVRKEILPPWVELRKRMDALRNIPPRRRELFSHLRTQMHVREESLNLLVDALQRNDQRKLDEFKEKWRQAELLLDQL